jgi:methylenetetrahydrofolate dehydrogenase (NADP+)/methenyltetrahydrofolate cyclohydrolase/formyltetrahydrofolate synthetase
MVATIIDGKTIAQQIRSNIQDEIKELQSKHHDFTANLVIFQIGDRPDSSTYVKMKLKAAEEAGVGCELVKLPEATTEFELLSAITKCNEDITVDGILVQLPLPDHIDEVKVTNAVLADKDVDGFGPFNVGELAKKGGEPNFLPCTPKGILELLDHHNVSISGKNAVVLGRSDIVGKPIASLLTKNNATVTTVHSKTALEDIKLYLSRADIVVAAIGQPQFVQGEWLKEGAVVIDVGTNFIPDSTKKSGSRMVGDVEFEAAKEKASLITPVPGGVGPMTVACLLENVILAAKRHYAKNNETTTFSNPLKLDLLKPVPSDYEISRAQQPKKIDQVAYDAGVLHSELELYGSYKAKVSLNILDRLKQKNNGKYVLVTGITPTPLGEGKSTTTVGLAQALGAHLNKNVFANVRQPSMGPTFGIKGGAAGGGYSQVIPMDEFNMHLTGDIHAISAAQNLLCAAVDTRMFHEYTSKSIAGFYKRLVPSKKGKRTFTPSMLARLQKLGINKSNPDDLTAQEIEKFAHLNIDPESITIKRVVDCNDRFVREMTIGQGKNEAGKFPPRKTGMDITVASELMAILALSSSLQDLRARVGRVVVGTQKETGVAITAEDIGCAGAITALLKDAIKPNLMQSLEGTPVFVHAGPFANISIGASSVIADQLALKLTAASNPINKGEKGFVVTEAGFDFTMGGERFFNIKCRTSGLKPNTVVLVATSRALKLHGGAPDVKPGQALPTEYVTENLEFLEKGCANMAKQIANIKQYNVPVVVAINEFETDTDAEIELIKDQAIKAGADFAVPSDHWAKGGAGAFNLAKAVVEAVKKSDETPQQYLYDVNDTVENKLSAVAQKMYGANGIELSPLAKQQIETYTKQGYAKLPICIAKTQYSLSHDPALKGVPTNFTVPIREVRCSAGAGYLYALAAEIMTIPGLPTHAGFMNVEVNEDGEIEGLF